mmetsp:Transcript_19605/g.48242  ORF Transcript_19605/g.48242 Transcript_19605/m.48242 type:complete len:132 (-) Transcript_19605:63-458(-)
MAQVSGSQRFNTVGTGWRSSKCQVLRPVGHESWNKDCQNCPLNIFPLNFFLDSVIGFWDSQKKMVTDSLSEEIMYFEMNPAEIFEWHKFQDHKDSTLLAPDGVHPNAKCYDLWATSLGTRIAKTVPSTFSR